MVKENDPVGLAQKIKWVIDLPQNYKNEIVKRNRQIVVQQHNLDNLAKKITQSFS